MANFLKINEIVWAKIKGYPWWPAIVAKLPKHQEDCYRVNFFGEQTHALVLRKDLHKYQQKYEEFSDKKNKKLISSIQDANKCLQKQSKKDKEAEESPKKPRSVGKLKVVESSVSEYEQMPKQQSEQEHIIQEQPQTIQEQFLEVDLKKINNLEIEVKEIIKQFIECHYENQKKSQITEFFKKLNISNILNNQELTKTKLPNIIKFFEVHLTVNNKQCQQLIKLLNKIHKDLQQKIISWLTNTEYYQKFINFDQQSKDQGSDFIEKVMMMLKKHYHVKKQNAKKISERLFNELQNDSNKRRKNILRQLKKKSIDLKHNKKQILNTEQINSLVQKILNQ